MLIVWRRFGYLIRELGSLKRMVSGSSFTGWLRDGDWQMICAGVAYAFPHAEGFCEWATQTTIA